MYFWHWLFGYVAALTLRFLVVDRLETEGMRRETWSSLALLCGSPELIFGHPSNLLDKQSLRFSTGAAYTTSEIKTFRYFNKHKPGRQRIFDTVYTLWSAYYGTKLNPWHTTRTLGVSKLFCDAKRIRQYLRGWKQLHCSSYFRWNVRKSCQKKSQLRSLSQTNFETFPARVKRIIVTKFVLCSVNVRKKCFKNSCEFLTQHVSITWYHLWYLMIHYVITTLKTRYRRWYPWCLRDTAVIPSWYHEVREHVMLDRDAFVAYMTWNAIPSYESPGATKP